MNMSLSEFMEDQASDSSTGIYPLSKLASHEWRNFALYTVENRAIPNGIDGMKPSQRFYLYSSIKNTSTEFKKVSAVAGVVSGYGYNHGETSAQGTGQLMAADWNNNICLIEGRGSFGTRLVQEAAAARYTYTRLHKNFAKYVKDLDLAPVHSDPEHEPPAFYVPVIPLVLANGVKGIATGFATDILPRDPVDIARACKEFVETGKIGKRIKVKYPHFNGKVRFDESENRHYCEGTFEKKSKTVLLITEVPYGFDREGYIKVLDKLEDEGHIVGYDDLCDKSGFKFEVKLKQQTSANWDDEKIRGAFKLVKAHTENLTVIGADGNLKEYSDERDIVRDFCLFRNGILDARIKSMQAKLNEEARWLKVKHQFIEGVLDDLIVFKNQKKDQVGEQILKVTDALDTDIDRLLRLNISSLTLELVKELIEEIKKIKKELTFWNKTTVKEQFLSDLEEIK